MLLRMCRLLCARARCVGCSTSLINTNLSSDALIHCVETSYRDNERIGKEGERILIIDKVIETQLSSEDRRVLREDKKVYIHTCKYLNTGSKLVLVGILNVYVLQ